MNQDLMVLFQEIIYLKNKVWGIRNNMGHNNLGEYADIGTHWIALFCNRNETVYIHSFGVEHVPEEIKGFAGNKNIRTNIFPVQANDVQDLLILC